MEFDFGYSVGVFSNDFESNERNALEITAIESAGETSEPMNVLVEV